MKNFLLKNITIVCVSLAMVLSSCANRAPLVSSYQPVRVPSSLTSDQGENIPESDREFKVKDFDKEDYNDKIGYVILGLAGVALTVAGIVIPLMYLKK